MSDELTTTAHVTQQSIERSQPAYESLLLDLQDGVLLVTINRPEVLNALSAKVLRELERVMDESEGDGAVRVIVITGAGDRSFVAGADISELEALETDLDGHAHSHGAHRLLNKMADLPKPIIMAVNGYALGGGSELAMAGDIILASEKARFGQPEITLGIIPGFGGSFRLPRLVGRTKAMELILTGAMVDAAEAKRIGLVNEVYPPEELVSKAKEMAAKIAGFSPAVIALAKRAVNQGLEIDARSAADLEATYFGMAVGTDDRREGTKAFLEKRKPEFKGR